MNRREQIIQEVWQTLSEAVVDRKHPFHLITVSTADHGIPDSRLVTLRDADANSRTLRFHIDVRSPKFAQMTSNPNVAVLVYDPVKRLQLRLQGKVTLHQTDTVADKAWASSQLLSRRCYCQTLGPGSPVPQPTSSLPGDLESRQPTEEEADELGRANFCAAVAEITSLDWYSLVFTGHQRAHFVWNGDSWNSQWLVP